MVSTTPLQDISALPDVESRLLLSTAKLNFDEDLLDEIRTLSDQISDWESVTDKSIKKFSATFLNRALVESSTEGLPSDPMRRLGNFARFTNLRALRTTAAQLQFHRTCVEPLGVKHAYLKGIALYSQFGGNIADRFCRDIDVLVEERRFKEVILTAVKHGYRVVMSSRPLKFATSRNDIEFVTMFSGDVGLMSPDDVLIEVHRRLDKQSEIFDSNAALETTVSVKVSDVILNTLNWSLHFTYVCYHHSRHFWSHLHWIADLDLMIKSPVFDQDKLSETASAYGLQPTTNASIEFYDLISRPNLWHEAIQQPGLANDFLKYCLINLQGGLELENALKQNASGRDLLSDAQISPERSKEMFENHRQINVHPTLSQYLKYPVPAPLFWLYRVQRYLIFVRDRILKKSNLQKQLSQYPLPPLQKEPKD